MRAGRLIAVFAVAVLGLGLFSAGALAGSSKKKKSTSVIYFSGSPKFNNGGKVTVKGALNTVKTCRISRAVRLQLLDSTGVVTSTLDGKSTDSNGNFSLSGQLTKGVPAGTNSVRVKALKETAGKFVCKAGVSASAPVPAT
jgi:flagellar hook assembly protein FlgD